MKRRSFVSKNLALGALIPASYASLGLSNIENDKSASSVFGEDELVIERLSEGHPHKGKELAVIQPKTGEKYGLDWAECFHYIDNSKMEEYIQKNAVTI